MDGGMLGLLGRMNGKMDVLLKHFGLDPEEAGK